MYSVAIKSEEITTPKKKSTERVKAFRERQRARRPPKKAPKSALQRLREFRARQKALKNGVALASTVPAAQSSTIDNIDDVVNASTSNEASTSVLLSSSETSIGTERVESEVRTVRVVPELAMASHTQFINVADRVNILNKLEAGVNISEVANEYRISERSIRRYKQKSASIREFATDPKHLTMKRQRTSPLSDIENTLYDWFIQKKLLGDHVTDSIMIEKAKEINAECDGTSSFRASRGWLWSWKKKFNVSMVTHCEPEDPLRTDTNSFEKDFSPPLIPENVDEEDVYNMCESSLLWRSLPQKRSLRTDELAFTKREREQKVTIAFCANATGTHKLPLLFVNKFANPRALKHCRDMLPVIYKSQCNAEMNENIFREWYTLVFKESVRQRQLEQNRTGKVVLLIDHFRGYTFKEEELDDGQFILIFLPSNTLPITLPMNQGVITECKKLFRHKLLHQTLQYGGATAEFYADYDIKDCMNFISESWNLITTQEIYRSWSNILNRSLPSDGDIIIRRELAMTEDDMRQLLEIVSAEEVADWFTGCEKAELISEEQTIKKVELISEVFIKQEELISEEITFKEEDENVVAPSKHQSSPIEEEEIDRLLYFLDKLKEIEPKIEGSVNSIIDYYSRIQRS